MESESSSSEQSEYTGEGMESDDSSELAAGGARSAADWSADWSAKSRSEGLQRMGGGGVGWSGCCGFEESSSGQSEWSWSGAEGQSQSSGAGDWEREAGVDDGGDGGRDGGGDGGRDGGGEDGANTGCGGRWLKGRSEYGVGGSWLRIRRGGGAKGGGAAVGAVKSRLGSVGPYPEGATALCRERHTRQSGWSPA